MANLTEFFQAHFETDTDQTAADLRVMERRSSEIAYDVGTAASYFGERLSKVVVGESQGADNWRGAYDWWVLTLGGRYLGELRDGASGLTIHMDRRNHRNRSRSPYTAKIYGSSWSRGPVATFPTLRECRHFAESYGVTADCCVVTDKMGREIAQYQRDTSGRGERWFRAYIGS